MNSPAHLFHSQVRFRKRSSIKTIDAIIFYGGIIFVGSPEFSIQQCHAAALTCVAGIRNRMPSRAVDVMRWSVLVSVPGSPFPKLTGSGRLVQTPPPDGDGVVDSRASGPHLNLSRAMRHTLNHCGVPVDQIDDLALCTSCDARFFSHRRDHGLTGRHLSFVSCLF